MASVNKTLLSLRAVFEPFQFIVDEQGENFVVKSSPDNPQSLTKNKVEQILSKTEFTFSISGRRDRGQFKLTPTPRHASQKVTTQKITCALEQLSLQGEKAPFHLSEITSLLQPLLFHRQKSHHALDPWSEVNTSRTIVSPAFNKLLEETLLALMQESLRSQSDVPIVEIGSGVGYDFPPSLSSRLIRIQPGLEECGALGRKISDSIYRTDIAGFCQRLLPKNKRLPFIFALDVFDTMSQEERKKNLLQLSELQQKGDKIIILLDSTPLLNQMFVQLKKCFSIDPDLSFVPLPFVPLTLGIRQKYSVVMMPEQSAPQNYTFSDFLTMQMSFLKALGEKKPCKTHLQVYEFKEKFANQGLPLPVIPLEDYFVSDLCAEFQEVGYTPKSFYRHAFTTGPAPASFSTQDTRLIYRPVTDVFTLDNYGLNDPSLIQFLAEKQLEMPHFDEAFLQSAKAKNHQILGAEVLVVEATKN